MRVRTLMNKPDFITISTDSPITTSAAVAGDIVSYDASDGSYVIQKSTATISGTPIGIIVIPGSHNVYGDGKTAIMSLKPMNCSTPTKGGSAEQGMTWGVYESEVPNLPLFNQVVLTVSGTSPSSTASGYLTYSNLPSDLATFTAGSTCPTDTGTKYFNASDTSVSPSPYKGTARNSVYYQTSSPSVSTNCLSDFDGIGNSQILLKTRGVKDYETWLPTYNTATDYCAASCCDMYYTVGTKQGQWYLPSAGEMGYMVVRAKTLNTALSNVGGVQLSSSTYYWTSTGYDSLFSRLVYLYNGAITYGDKDDLYYVRAFARIK